LRDRAHDRIGEYSGGMKRRANIAVGLLHRPSLLILDEPTVGVDPQSRNEILGAVDALGAEGMAVMYTTHYMEEAERLCDRIGVLDQGRLIAQGTRRELVERIGANDVVTVEASDSAEAARLADHARRMPGVVSAVVTASRAELLARHGRALLPVIVADASRLGVTIAGVALREPDLETVFLTLTGRGLRD
jgi:ABC-2 type transport system ATP-binding protein